MVYLEEFGLFIGAIALGAIHGIEPGHGWPVAASYALDQTNKWVYGFAASFILGLGHLISSIAMVGAFFYAKAYFSLTQVNEPITVLEGVQIGGPVSLVAGVLLIALGIREYIHGHSHGNADTDTDQTHEGDHQHDHGHTHAPVAHQDHAHKQGHAHAIDHQEDETHEDGHSHGQNPGSIVSRLKAFIPFVGGHDHGHGDMEEATDRGLVGIAWFAFVLGFAHEEEFEIIALCAGSNYCLELMSVYAIAVIVGIVGLTMLLIAGYHYSAERVERYTPYLPIFSATVLIIMGLGFISGVF